MPPEFENVKPKKPKNLKEIPAYLKKLISSFFSRLFYIIKLVWESSHALLLMMVFMAIFNGVMPIVGSLIGKELLNKLADAYSGALTTFSIISFLLIMQFAYLLFNTIVVRVNSTISSICGEKLANHIKLKIMNKAK